MIAMKKALLGVASLVFAAAMSAQAAEIEIKGQGVKFAPEIIKANVGDVLKFRNMATHFVESIDAMVPPGAPKMLSEMGADYDYTVTTEGLYVFKCPPHWGARMGAVMIVGNPANLGDVVDQYIARAEAEKTEKPAAGLLKKFKEEVVK